MINENSLLRTTFISFKKTTINLKMKLNYFLDFLNGFPMKIWVAIYISILSSHIVSLILGYNISTLGFLLSVVTYFILLTKTKLWVHSTFLYSAMMFFVFAFVSIMLVTTDYINFYEICLLLGVYELSLMILFYKLPIKTSKSLDRKKTLFIRNLFCVILLVASIYYIPLGLSGIFSKTKPVDVSNIAYPLYLVAVICVLLSIIIANIIIKEKEPRNQFIELTVEDQSDIDKISFFFQNDKSFLKQDFSLNELSLKIGIEKRRLSHLINDNLKTNFYQLIAFYRIEEAKKIMEMENDYTLDYISMKCGFSSIPIFIKYFKMFTGDTPKKYRDTIKV